MRASRKQTAPEALKPLAERYAAAGQDAPAAEMIPSGKVPQPYRKLLVHRQDMTSTLEKFHRGPLHIRIISFVRSGGRVRREVVLQLDGTNQPVEFGAITIHLGTLPPAARKLVLEATLPLGGILHRCRVRCTSRPSAYFRIRTDATIARALRLKRVQTLYGRCNTLRTVDERPIAEIVEILPPTRKR